MQNNLFTSIRSLKLIDGCKGTQVFALNPDKPHLRPSFSLLRSKSIQQNPCGPNAHHRVPSTAVFNSLLPYGLPLPDGIDPPIDPFLRPVDPVSALAASFRRSELHNAETFDLHMEQHSLLRPLADPRLLRRSLRSACLHAPDAHHHY